jgi:hypothetical protein
MTARTKVIVGVGVAAAAAAALWWHFRKPKVPKGSVQVIEGTRYTEAEGQCWDLDTGTPVDASLCVGPWYTDPRQAEGLEQAGASPTLAADLISLWTGALDALSFKEG